VCRYVEATKCSFYDNWGYRGGAIFVEAIGRATLEDCTFKRNDAGQQRRTGFGGALAFLGGAPVQVGIHS
jgi:hypothetical protein